MRTQARRSCRPKVSQQIRTEVGLKLSSAKSQVLSPPSFYSWPQRVHSALSSLRLNSCGQDRNAARDTWLPEVLTPEGRHSSLHSARCVSLGDSQPLLGPRTARKWVGWYMCSSRALTALRHTCLIVSTASISGRSWPKRKPTEGKRDDPGEDDQMCLIPSMNNSSLFPHVQNGEDKNYIHLTHTY